MAGNPMKPTNTSVVHGRLGLCSGWNLMATAASGILCRGQAAFTVSGSLVKTSLAADGKVQGSESSRFEMTVSGDTWQLKDFTEGEKFREITCDGTNIFHFEPSDVTQLPKFRFPSVTH